MVLTRTRSRPWSRSRTWTPGISCMDMDTGHGHGHWAWAWTPGTGMDKETGSARPWTPGMGMNIGLEMDTGLGHRHEHRISTLQYDNPIYDKGVTGYQFRYVTSYFLLVNSNHIFLQNSSNE